MKMPQMTHILPTALLALTLAVPGAPAMAAITSQADPIPTSASELAKATITVPLDASQAKAALISRQTQGNRAWLILGNDYGNESTLAVRRTACSMADRLMPLGGAGLSRDQLSERLEALQATWSLDRGGISIEAPRENVDAALDILLAVWTSPALPVEEFERIKAASIARLEAALKDPIAVAASSANLRFNNYPAGHPYQPRSLQQQLAESRTGPEPKARSTGALPGRG